MRIMQFPAAHSTRPVQAKDPTAHGSAAAQDKLVMNLASGTALVDASGKASKRDDGQHSEASCSTATGLTSSSWSSAQSSGVGLGFVGSVDRFADLLEDVGDVEVGSSNAQRVPDAHCQPISEEASVELTSMGFSEIVFKLNQESGPFCNFPASVLVAAAPTRLGHAAPIIFRSGMFETNFGHVLNDTTMNQCMFDIYDTTGAAAKRLEAFRGAIGSKGSWCSTALAVQIALRNYPCSEFRMKLVDIDDEAFIVAIEDTANAVERWDALMSQHFFYWAPMERQMLDRR